jgi:hypothetical protein
MKLAVFALVLIAMDVAVAGELLDRVIEQNHSIDSGLALERAHSEPPIDLDPITVYLQGDPFGSNLGGLRNAMPCLGCDGKRFGRPFALELGIGLGLFAARPFFQQPRIRGEPNDEAAYYTLRMAQCLDDSPGCLDRQPNSGLYNWAPSERAEDDWTLNPANSILRSK